MESLNRPRITLQVVEDRTESELTFRDRDEEATKSSRVATTHWVLSSLNAKLLPDLLLSKRLVSSKDVGFRAL